VVMRIREIVWILIGLALMNKKATLGTEDFVENEKELTYAHSVAKNK